MRSRVGSAAQLKHARNSRQSDNDALLTKGIANVSFGSEAATHAELRRMAASAGIADAFRA
jgi:hypothetical protein